MIKTTEELIAEWQQKVDELSAIDAGTDVLDTERLKFWKEAQLDAIKHGMTIAAEQVRGFGMDSIRRPMREYASEILTARDNLNEI